MSQLGIHGNNLWTRLPAIILEGEICYCRQVAVPYKSLKQLHVLVHVFMNTYSDQEMRLCKHSLLYRLKHKLSNLIWNLKF